MVEKVHSEDDATSSLVDDTSALGPAGGVAIDTAQTLTGKPMQILNVAQTYFPYLAEGGRPVKVRILSRKLASRGHEVTVLTVNLGSAEWLALNLTPQKTSAGWRSVEDGVEAIYLRTCLRYRAIT